MLVEETRGREMRLVEGRLMQMRKTVPNPA
jgi:hypothetical protein